MLIDTMTTIADSVARLRAVEASHKVIVVINDGSDDDTGEVLTGWGVDAAVVAGLRASGAI